MGKGQQGDKRQPQNQQQSQQKGEKKKIIKKFPFKKTTAQADEGQLKDWKPTKIERKANENNDKKIEKVDLAETFLGSLSKPINKTAPTRPSKQFQFFDEDDNAAKIPIKPKMEMKKLTPEQIKWDIEDQTFIRKQFVPKEKVEHQLEENQEEEEQQQVVIKSKGQQNITASVRHVDLSKIIDKDWQEAAQRKAVRNQLWQGAQEVLDGRGSLARMAKDALDHADEIDDDLNKRTQEKRQMRNRYGW